MCTKRSDEHGLCRGGSFDSVISFYEEKQLDNEVGSTNYFCEAFLQKLVN